MISKSNKKVSIPKEVFENLFFQEGGEKRDIFKALTGEYQFALDDKRPISEPNAEIEGGEYLFDSQGIRKAEGKSHEKGGMKVSLEDGTKILSDHLKIGADIAKIMRDQHGIEAKATDTYSKVVDRFNKKSGLEELNSKLEDLGKSVKKQETKVKDETTSSLNLDFLNKQLYDTNQKKQPIEKQREKVFNLLFELQEDSKKEEKSTNVMQDGGYLELANKYNISEERAAELLGLPKYQPGGKTNPYTVTNIGNSQPILTKDGQYSTGYGTNIYSGAKREKQHAGTTAFGAVEAEAALQNLYRNFPDLVSGTLKDYVEIGSKGELKFKGGIPLNKQQAVIGTLQKQMDTRMRDSAQNVINNPAKYGPEAVKSAQDYLENQTFNKDAVARGFDEKLGQFTSGRYAMQMNLVTPEDQKMLADNGIFTLKQLKNSPLRDKLSKESLSSVQEAEKEIGTTDADYAIGKFNVANAPTEVGELPQTNTETVNTMGIYGGPQRIYNRPTLYAPLKVATRLNRIEPALISPEQQLAEQDRAVQGQQQNLAGLSDAQRAAASIGLAASQITGSNKAIQEANRFNTQAQNQANVYNAKIGDSEQMAENKNALSYEQRLQRGLANYEQDLQSLNNLRYSDQVNNFKTIEMLNLQNAYNPQVQYMGPSQGFDVRYTQEDLNKMLKAKADALASTGTTTQGKYGVSTKNTTPSAKFGGRFKK